MKASTNFVALLATTTSAAVVRRRTEDVCLSKQNATEFSLTYGIPLLAFEAGVKSNNEETPTNELATTTLQGPQQTTIVSPNVDTWYLSLGFDLSQQDIELVVPEIENRFYSVSFFDPFGENYVTFGAQDGDTAGTYLLTPANTTNNQGKLVADCESYKGVVYAPSTQGAVLIRLLMKDESETDLLYEIADGFSTKLVDRASGPIGPTLESNQELFQNNSDSQGAHILNMTAWTEQAMPPLEHNATVTPRSTTRQLELAGIHDGEYDPVSCVNLTSAYTASTLSVGTYPAAKYLDVGNNWQLPPVIGQYGTDYRARASIASRFYLALTPDVALYPSYTHSFRLAANESLTLAFSGKPPLRDLGFWSMTLYNEEGYLVANELDRYSVSDRSGLEFKDGEGVYDSDRDGPFEVLVQAGEPPEEWMSNWLPSPSDGEGFDLVLRFYYAEEALSNGKYEYPKVTRTPFQPRGSNSTEKRCA